MKTQLHLRSLITDGECLLVDSRSNLFLGTLFAYMINQLIISHVTNGPFPVIFSIMYPLLLLAANAKFLHLFSDLAAAIVYLVFALLVYGHFVINIIEELCAFLKIHPFLI